MAGKDRASPDTLELLKALEENVCQYDFFGALRLLESIRRDKSRIGYAVKPADDCVRLGQEPSMAFAPSTLASFKASGSAGVPRLEQFFFGLFGPNGPLPLHLTAYTRDQLRNENNDAIARFADIFHHRLLSFFYRAWADSKPSVGLDRPSQDKFADRISSIVGVGSSALRNKDALPDYEKFYMSGRLSSQVRNAEGLLALISDYFDVPIELQQFVGNWINVPAEQQLVLGVDDRDNLLGVNTTLGEKAWQCQNKFRLQLGPLDLKTYRRFLPGQSSLARFVALVGNYVGPEFDWDIRLILKKNNVKPLKLSEFGQLGWTSWVGYKESNDDFDELVLNPFDVNVSSAVA